MNSAFIVRLTRLTAAFVGFITRTRLLMLNLFLVRFLLKSLKFHPRNSNPSTSSEIIEDFFALISSPLSFKNFLTFGISSSVIFSRVLLVTIKSSAYLTHQLPASFLPFALTAVGKSLRITFSNPFSTILHNKGDRTPPCGVPIFGTVHVPLSTIGAFNHLDTSSFPFAFNSVLSLFSRNL